MSEPLPRPFRRIVVALDGSRHSEAALEAAARLASVFDSQLTGIFVEDRDVLQAVEYPFAAEIGRLGERYESSDSGSVRRQYRTQALRARRTFDFMAKRMRLRHEFQHLEGAVGDLLVQAADEADLITLGQSGSVAASRMKLGTTARIVLARTRGPVLILRRGLRLDLPVVVVYDCDAEDRDEALEIAAVLARQDPNSEMVVLLAGDSTDVCSAAGHEVAARLASTVPSLITERVQCDVPEDILERAHRRRAGVLIIPAGSRGVIPVRLQRLVADARVPVMIVRGS